MPYTDLTLPAPASRSRRPRSGRLLSGLLAASLAGPLAAGCRDPALPFDNPTVIPTTGDGNTATARAVVTLADGRILIAGDADVPNPRVLLARFLANGKLDTSFGSGGTVITDLSFSNVATGSGSQALAVQPDGKIVVAGHSWPTGAQSQVAVARYSANGVLDPSFGSGGWVHFDSDPVGAVPGQAGGDSTYAVALQHDGKILVGGGAAQAHGAGPNEYWSDSTLLRLDANGTLDASFGAGGIAIHDTGNSSFVRAISLLADGRIVIAGMAAPSGGTYDTEVARYLATGQPDPSFGAGGFTTVDLGGDDRGYALSVLANGSYVVAGQATINGATEFALSRFDSTGHLDASFGTAGSTLTAFPKGASVATGLAATGSGYWVGGYAIGVEGNLDFAIARYTNAGALATCQGQTAMATLPLTVGQNDAAFGLALQPDGTPVLAGYSGSNLAIDRVDGIAPLECLIGVAQ